MFPTNTRPGDTARTRHRFSTHAFWTALLLLSCLALYRLAVPDGSISGHGITSSIHHIRDLSTFKPHSKDKCSLVYTAVDQCEYVRQNCANDDDSFAAYLDLYYCRLSHAKPFAFALLLIWISTLFSTIGIAASDFFCVNLSTIAAGLGMSESMAGVTLLAFGNGSPDVFSTFSAMSTNSSSLAIGELIGAASFITAVVAGSMALVRPFKVAKKSFVRDVTFFIVAAAFSMAFLVDGRLHLWECLFMVAFYLFYVLFVLLWHWRLARKHKSRTKDDLMRGHYTEVTDDIENTDHDGEDGPTAPRPTMTREPSATTFRQLEPLNEDQELDLAEDDEVRDHWLGEISNNMHLNRPSNRGRQLTTLTPIRPSLVGALEFQAVLSSLSKSRALQTIPMLARSYSDNPRTVDPTSANESSHLLSGSRHSRNKSEAVAPTPARSSRPGNANRMRAVSTNDALNPGLLSSTSRPQMQPSQSLLDIVEERRASLDDRITSSPEEISESSSGNTPIYTATHQPDNADNLDETGPTPPLAHHRHSSSDTHSASTRQLLLPQDLSFDATSTSAEDKTPRWWPTYLPPPREIWTTLFPTLCRWRSRSWLSRIVSLVGVPSIFLLTITLPVVCADSDDAHEPDPPSPAKSYKSTNVQSLGAGTDQDAETAAASPRTAIPTFELPGTQTESATSTGWRRWLTIIQLFLAPLMIVIITYTQYIQPDGSLIKSLIRPILISLLFSTVTLIPFLLTSTPDHRPKLYQPILALAGFVMSIAWISTIAAQVVALLKTFAIILQMSHAIMGLTFFAVGNSLSDLVADITVARLGFPVMALSACFGGPMLNILLGIGLSGSWILIRGAEKRHAKHPDKDVHYRTYEIAVGDTLIVSGVTLLVGLVGLLVVVPLNKWMMDKRVAWGLISLWVLGTAINVIIELV